MYQTKTTICLRTLFVIDNYVDVLSAIPFIFHEIQIVCNTVIISILCDFMNVSILLDRWIIKIINYELYAKCRYES